MELSGSTIKKFLIFSQDNYFLIFQGTELSYISGNKTPKNLFMFQEVTFQAKKNKNNEHQENFLYFRKQKLPQNFFYFLKRKLFLYSRKQKL